jgi:hypothetical protein
LNPTERLWQHTRKNGTHNRFFSGLDALLAALTRVFGEMQSHPQFISSYLAPFCLSLCPFSYARLYRRAPWQDPYPVEGRHGAGPGRTEPHVVGVGVIQITPQMRILVAIEAVDGRKGIDSLARLCEERLAADPFSGSLFVFRSRRGTSIRILVYDGQGFWLAQKRLSKGRFVWWPSGKEPARRLEAHQAQLLLAAGNPETDAAPVWRKVS